MYCPKCYRKNTDDAEICSACGHRLRKTRNIASNPTKETKYCSHCGAEILLAAVICPKCGCPTESAAHAQDKPSTILDVLSFFIPIVGLIAFFVFHNNYPRKAKAVGGAALIGFLFWLSTPFLVPAIFNVIF